MKKTITFFATIFLLFGNVYAQNLSPLKLSGTIKDVQDGKIYLQQFNNKIFDTIDSAIIENGKFQFSKTVQLPELYGITLDKNKTPFYIFLENAPISIALDTASYYKNTVIKGSKSQIRYEDFRTRPVDLKIEDFIQEDPSSIVSAYVLYRNFSYRLSPEEIIANVNRLDNTLQTTQYVTVLNDLAKTMETVLPGKKAPDFISTTPTGAIDRFSDHLGKGYILLDFWAAWCGPCRRENPNVVAAFQKYKDRGFTVYGVSLDRDKDSWLKAIEDDKLTWPHVSDLTFWNSKAAAIYGVRAIPSNFLIAPNGEIVARNLKGEDLHKKLEELLSK